jgi:predicted ribosomally synthesized peptide with SipW-like signal peptide
MKKILISLVMVLAMTTLLVGATRAYFSDNETSNGNTFGAGTLDLNLDGGNTNVVKFTVTDMKPGDSQTGTWTVHNAGSIAGYLDLESITKSSDEYACTEPESTAGDLTCDNPGAGQGELLGLLNIQLFVDANNNGTYDGGDILIYNGLASGLAASYDQNLSLGAGGTNYITMVVSWPSSASDNLGQSDRLNLGMTFELGQTTGQ